jgi:hypothetical protein
MFTHDYVHVLLALPSKQREVQGSARDNFAWIAWELVKVKNHSYHKAITMHGLKRYSFHERFQIEILWLL